MPNISNLEQESKRNKNADFMQAALRKRRFNIDTICAEIRTKHHFKQLNENSEDDIAKIMPIVFRLFPEITYRTRREYCKTVILMLNMESV